jgi:hypothetical protein
MPHKPFDDVARKLLILWGKVVCHLGELESRTRPGGRFSCSRTRIVRFAQEWVGRRSRPPNEEEQPLAGNNFTK